MNELLSPAGTIEAFYAAISNGCDAIYLGLDKFNARAYAANFTVENLKELIKFAHLRNVRIFVTMNTILYDDELDEAFKLVDELANIHVDALIIQDLAILNYVTNKYKSLEAHASTQMGIDDVDGTLLLKELGATRVVFARETPINILKEVKEKVDIQIESFIHGALCVGYSGNCLMSSMIGERSGNRGRCAGCCRQLYSLIDLDTDEVIKNGYLLSMKDLNVSQNIDEMRFIDSFKIEGRMKEPTYIAGVTNIYRRLIDNEKVDLNDLNKVFNRTYTKGFSLGDNGKEITNFTRPNNNGFLIGEIAKINKNKVWIRLLTTLSKGDYIRIESSKSMKDDIILPIQKLFDASFNLTESVKKMAIIYTDKKLALGMKVYKVNDSLFNHEIEETLLKKEYKKLPLDVEFIAHINEPILLKISYKNFVQYVKSEEIVTNALSKPIAEENIYKQLNKLNDTPYFINRFEINLDQNAFISLKTINEIRRKGIEGLNEQRLNKKIVFNKKPTEIVPKDCQLTKPEITVEVQNTEQFNAAKELGIKHIYFKNKIRRNNPCYQNLDSIEENEILIGGLGSLEHFKNSGYEIVTDYSFNVANHLDAGILSSLGASRITLSEEINKKNINELVERYQNKFHTCPNLELIIYGRTYLMHTKYCPLKRLNMCGECKKRNFALKDKFETFPLMFNDDCTINILNGKILNLIDDISTLTNVNFYRLRFFDESKDDVKRIITIVQNRINGVDRDIKTFDPKKHTRGHFVKNPL